MPRFFTLIFLALVLAVTVTYRESFLRLADYDEGDDAANALQIERAKHLTELHGNYSRWGFHHPGPAFFYVYALGEAVLYDGLHLAQTPRAAHVYTGTLLQLAFFSLALALLARHARQPLLVLALGIALAGWQYAHVDRAVYSIWPPDVLLMPMLCFLIACAATAIGDRLALPIMVAAGSFLVHGHVAQPLFVVPLALAAFCCAGYTWRRRLGEELRGPAPLTAAVLLALFLLPLILDLFAGRDSNAYDIYLHLKYQSDGGRTLAQSALCYASYFIGMNDPTMFNQITDETAAPFAERAGWLVGWTLTLAFAVWALFRKPRQSAGKESGRFGRRLLWFWLGAGALTLVWGMRQDGGFTNFNSHFNHSLVFVVGLLGILGLTRVLPTTSRAFQVMLLAASIPVFALSVQYRPDEWSRGDEVAANLRTVLRADPKPDAPKLITFSTGDDEPEWYEAVTIARELQRRGVPFYVSSDWSIMFGADRVFANQDDVLARGGVSVWKVVPRKAAPGNAHVINRQSAVVFPKPPVQPLPFRIAFENARETAAAVLGLSSAEDGWAWTSGHLVLFACDTPAATGPLELTLEASGHTRSKIPRQNCVVLVNGQRAGEVYFDSERRAARVTVPERVWNACSPRTIALELPNATSPARITTSGDRRLLGLRFYSMTVSPAQAEAPHHDTATATAP